MSAAKKTPSKSQETPKKTQEKPQEKKTGLTGKMHGGRKDVK